MWATWMVAWKVSWPYVKYGNSLFMDIVDGREIAPLKESEIVEQCRIIREKGLNHVGIYVCKALEQS